jgi:hypothetical protein
LSYPEPLTTTPNNHQRKERDIHHIRDVNLRNNIRESCRFVSSRAPSGRPSRMFA